MKRNFLSIADGSAPFFLESDRSSHNWSKAPLSHLEKSSLPSKKKHKRVRESFSSYTKRISKIGFNAVSLDEFCYLANYPFYPDILNKKIRSYRKKYKKLFKIAVQRGLQVFLTSDFFSGSEEVFREIGNDEERACELFQFVLEDIFREFPEISGLILRIGESDGVDVTGDFKSKLFLKKPEQANRLLGEILPIFEKHNKTLIFRTWTLGAYEIGDLIWNRDTYRKVFQGIESNSLVVSMKYGEGDFFRYLSLNPLFFEDGRPKLLELQARREYEGFGEYPSFVGWLYQSYRDVLLPKANLAGISVWTQTGGWSSFKNITFLKRSSYWNELNAFVSLKLFQNPKKTLEDCVKDFYGKKNLATFLLFLKYSDRVIENILYDPGFSRQTLYIHRVRIPTLLHATWDRITVSDPFRRLYSFWNASPSESVRLAEESFPLLKEMKRISKKLKLPYDARFQEDTFQLLLNARKLLYKHNPILFSETKRLTKRYHKKYPNTFRFQFAPPKGKSSFAVGIILKMFVRKKKEYRILDRILFSSLFRKIYYLFFLGIRKRLPDFVNRQGMPIRELLG